jgi:Bacterial Ig-like domain (group 3)/FG-GAP-like repeat
MRGPFLAAVSTSIGLVILLHAAPRALAQQLPLAGFSVTAAPNPATSAQHPVTFTAILNPDTNPPTGTVSFTLSSSTTCTPVVANMGAGGVTFVAGVGYRSTLSYMYTLPAGANTLCADYSGDGNYLPAHATAAFTEYLANVTASAPATAVQNQPVSLVVNAVANPAGGPVPTGTVDVSDYFTGTEIGTFPLTAGTNGSAATVPLNNLIPGDHGFQIVYSGDGNYSQLYINSTIFIQGALTAVAPATVPAASPDTVILVAGLDFTNASVVQLTGSNSGPVNLATTFVSATRLQATVPAAMMTAASAYAVTVNTGAASNALAFTVFNKFADQVTATDSFSETLAYGNTGPLTVTAGVSPAASTPGVPTGSVSFAINGTALQGVATLSGSPGPTPVYVQGTSSTIDSLSYKIITADFNGDGRSDVLSEGNSDSSHLQLLLNAGHDTLQTEYALYSGCAVADFAVIDLNRDGNSDIAVACADASAQTPYGVYLLGNGDGTFQAPVTFATSQNADINTPYYIAAGDFNGDGSMDIALLDGLGNLQVFTGSATFGAFTPLAASTYPVPYGQPIQVETADFDQDGKSDIAALEYSYNGSATTGDLLVFTSAGNGTFSSQEQTFTTANYGTGGQRFVITDVTGAGYPSILVPNSAGFTQSVGSLLVDQNNGAGVLTMTTLTSAPGISTVGAALFPAVGKPAAPVLLFPAPNIFYSIVDNTAQTVSIQALATSSQGGGLAVNTEGTVNNIGFIPYCDCSDDFIPISVSDLNADGNLDLIVETGVSTSSNTDQFTPIYATFGAGGSLSPAFPLLPPGTYNLVASYSGDADFVAANSPADLITVTQATPTPVVSGPSTSVTGQSVTFTATILGVTGGVMPTGIVQFSYDNGILLGGPQTLVPGTNSSTAATATAALPAGVHTITAAYSGDGNYIAGSANYQITIASTSNLTLTSLTPASGTLGSTATVVSLIGTGFLPNTIAQLNGAPIATTFVSATQLQATIPASFFTTIQTGTITVTTPGVGGPSAGLPFNVTEPPVQVVLTGPPTAPPATQPTITFQLPTAYPLPITGIFTLTVQPTTAGGVVDPAVQFAGGGDTFTFTLPANTTTTPTVQLQSGTLDGTITVALTLTAGGDDITPAGLQPVVIQVPASAPVISSLSLARSETTLTVTIQGFSNTRDMKSANFTFTAASGATVNNPNVTVPLDSAFITWYTDTVSDQFGSAFTYTQTFVLTDNASTIGGVSATLVNSIGTSNSLTSQ